jgi:L-fuculose-phosphate aldolase
MLQLRDLKRQIVRICHLLAEKDYVSAMDGNVSARLPDGTFLATPTMIHKGFVTEDDLVIIDDRGRKLQGPPGRQPTSELFMHLAAYKCRPDVQAVVHAHPPTAIAFTLAGETLARCVLPEVVLTLGKIPTAPYETTGTHALAHAIGELMATHDAVMMDRHGAICVGSDLIDAYGKLEKVEHTAMITWKARMLGRVRELECAEVEKLREMGRKYSSRGTPPPACEGCGGCPTRTPWQEKPLFTVGRLSQAAGTAAEHTRDAPATRPSLDLERIVTEEVVRALSGR